MRSYTARTNTQPTRLIKDADDLEAQFESIVETLRRDVRRTRQQVERYARAYQRTAEALSRHAKSGEPDEATQRAYRQLKQLQLVIQTVESNVAYLLGSGITPEPKDGEGSLDVAQRVLDSLEAERQRLYRDVHDGPAQVLANAIFEVEYLERIADRAPGEMRQTLRTELASLRAQFKSSLDSVRAMIYDLRPPELTELGLAEAMRNYTAEWEMRCGIKVMPALDTAETDLPPAHELAVYRILQEALQNVHKHAHANTVGVAWQRSSQAWALHVTDDGVGFDLVKAARRAKSVGLLSMRERAELIGGSLQIQSMPGKGTAVTLLLPAKGNDRGDAADRAETSAKRGRPIA